MPRILRNDGSRLESKGSNRPIRGIKVQLQPSRLTSGAFRPSRKIRSLTAGMEYLQSAGVAEIGLEVDGNNTPAIRLYHSAGLAKVGELNWFELNLTAPVRPHKNSFRVGFAGLLRPPAPGFSRGRVRGRPVAVPPVLPGYLRLKDRRI